jgi:outer membrane protein assembly factor BamB
LTFRAILLCLLTFALTAAVPVASEWKSARQLKVRKGQVLAVSATTGKTIRKFNGGQKGDEFGIGLGFDGLPGLGNVAAFAIGAPGAESGAGRVFAVDSSTGRRVWFVSGASLAGGPVERFGQSMAGLGHINGDDPVHWAVGAPGPGPDSEVPAAVVVLHEVNGQLGERMRVEGDNDSRLGWQVIFSDDETGDSFIDHFVAGAPGQSNGSNANAGALHRFSAIDGTRRWTLLGKKKSQHLGYSMTFADDEDDDGVRDLTVGAPGNAKTDGLVMIVSAATGRVIRQIKAPKGASLFGLSIARADLDGDGEREIVVGAPASDGEAGEEVGRVLAFTSDGSLVWSREGELAGQWFGISVSPAPDTDGGGLQELVIGSLFRQQQKKKKELRGGIDLISAATDQTHWQLRGKRGDDLVGLPGHGSQTDLNGDGVGDLLVGAPRNGELFIPE